MYILCIWEIIFTITLRNTLQSAWTYSAKLADCTHCYCIVWPKTANITYFLAIEAIAMNPIFTLSKGRLLLAVAIIASSLTACGQKGALYLPEANTSVVSPTPTPADDSTQPVVSANPQNPNVISNDPTDPATTATEQGTKDDY